MQSQKSKVGVKFWVAPSLNMPHDDDQKCADWTTNSSLTTKVMSRMLDHNTNPWEWSLCSSRYVTAFLEYYFFIYFANYVKTIFISKKCAYNGILISQPGCLILYATAYQNGKKYSK
jgi:hypothetical protein